MFLEPILGVQIEKEAVFLVCMGRSLKGVEVAACERYPLAGASSHQDRAKAAAGAISDFIKANSLSPVGMAIGVSRSMMVLRNITMPSAAMEDLKSAIGYELEKYIPFPPEEACFDFSIVHEDREEKALDILLAVARQDDISPYFELGTLTGIPLIALTMDSCGIVEALMRLRPGLKKGSFGLVYQPVPGVFHLLLVRNGVLAASRILKGSDGPDPSAQCEAVAKELSRLQAAQREPGAFSRLFLLGPFSSRGQGALAPIESCLRDKGLEVELLDPSIPGLPSAEFLPAFGHASAALRDRFGCINFLPASLRKRPSRLPYYVAAALLSLLIVLFVAWIGRDVMARRQIHEDLQAELVQLKAEAKRIEEKCRRYEELKGQLDEISALVSRRGTALEALREIALVLPDTAWIKEFRLTGNDVVISGFAQNSTELIPLLEDSALFCDVVFLSSIKKTPDGLEQFRIGLKIEGGK